MRTTLLKTRSQMTRSPLPDCHDGVGTLDWVTVLDGDDLTGRRLKFVHDDVMPPGSTIGLHGHDDEEEYYLVLEGKGTMTLDGKEYPIGPGDIAALFPGGEHGLANTGDTDMRLIVFAIDPR